MSYVPNALDPTQPTGDKKVASAPPEFRAIKTLLDATYAAQTTFQARLDALEIAIGAGTNSVALAANLASTVSPSNGDALLGVKQPYTGALARTQHLKNTETVSIDDFVTAAGTAPGIGGDDTLAFINAIAASGGNGGYGTVLFSSGKVYNISATSIDGILGLTLKGKNGGNVGNLSSGSSGGATVLRFTNTTGDSLSFTGVAYHGAQLTIEDLAIFTSTSGYGLVFNNFSQINLNRGCLTNAGGTTIFTGNGLRLSNCYYVYGDKFYIWKTGTLYTVGNGITIDKGLLTTFLGGLYNFDSCSLYGWYNGMRAGNDTAGASSNENYAAINWTSGELNSNSIGISLTWGVRSFSMTGSYVEGNLVAGVFVANQAKNVNIKRNFFNNSTASTADVQLGVTGSGTAYTQFYDVDVSNNHFLSINKYGILVAAGPGTSYTADNNEFTLGSVGAVGISSNQISTGYLRAFARRNSFYGFPVGTSMFGYFTEQGDNHEFNSAGTFLGSWRQGNLLLPAFTTLTQLQPNDPDTTTITNVTAGARYVNATPAMSKNRRQFVSLTLASTQNVGLYKSDAVTLMVTLTPGKGAWMWNDGTNEYASLLP